MSNRKSNAITLRSLQPIERALVERLFSDGPEAFQNAGLNKQEQEEFLQRREVQAYIRQLEAAMRDHSGSLSRTRFIAQKQLQRLAPLAVQTLHDAMRGLTYKKKKNGETLMERRKVKGQIQFFPVVETYPPQADQIDTARDILDRLGIHDQGEVNGRAGGNVNIFVTDGSAKETLEYGEEDVTERQRIASRERVRSVMDVLAGKVQEAKKYVDGKLRKVRTIRSKAVENASVSSDSQGEDPNVSSSASGARIGDNARVNSEGRDSGAANSRNGPIDEGGDQPAPLSALWRISQTTSDGSPEKTRE